VLLHRTRRSITYSIKAFIFDLAGLQEMLDLRDKNRLEDSMGFRGQFDEHRRFQIALLKEQGLIPSHNILEIGCGPLTGGIPIIEYLEPGNYVGVDVRSSVLDLSWKEVGKAGLSQKNPRLICSSSFGSSELSGRTFDFILSFSVLYHLSDEILDTYFDMVRNRLKLNGVCFANVNIFDQSSEWLEFPFLKRTKERYQENAIKHGLRMHDLGELSDLGFRLSGQERRNRMLSFRIK
jgi:cyclopropane fatty-acyl-phospholipid synthase-like methyltransferase